MIDKSYFRKLRKIIILVWGLLFILNLAICLLNPNVHPVSWAVVGFFLGGILIMWMNDKILRNGEDFEELLLHIIDGNHKQIKSIYNRYDLLLKEYTELKKKKNSIEMKGGRKRKKK